MLLSKDVWVVAADGEKYQVFKNEGTATKPDLKIVDQDDFENLRNSDQAADKAGRMTDHGASKSAMQQTDWHRLEKSRFAAELGKRLNTWSEAQYFEKIVVVADPRTLGNLRTTWSARLRDQIVLELGKDFTNLSVNELTESLLHYSPD